jgi:tetratricopeptide (TPR) repeat protein
VLPLLAALVAKSMVVADPQAGAAMRYRLLEMSREYAREKLEAAGNAVATRNRHRDYFVAFVGATQIRLGTLDFAAWHRQRAAERDNLRQALEWSFSETSAQVAVDAAPRLVKELCGFFPTWEENLTWSKRGVSWCESHPEIGLELYARVLGSVSNLMSLNDLPLALNTIQKAVAISRRLGPAGRVILMWNLTGEGLRYREAGDCELAIAPYAEAEAIYWSLPPEQQDPGVPAFFAQVNADLALEQGRYQDAKTLASESIRFCEAGGDKHGCIRPHMTWGMACIELGDYDQAHIQFQHALELSGLHTGDMQDNNESYARLWHACTDLRQGQLVQALDYCLASVRQANNIPDYNIIASALGVAALIWAKQDQAQRAATLAGASHAMYARQSRKPWEDTSLNTLLPGWREKLEQAAIQQAYEAGKAMNSEEAVVYALSDTSA